MEEVTQQMFSIVREIAKSDTEAFALKIKHLLKFGEQTMVNGTLDLQHILALLIIESVFSVKVICT